MVFPPLDNRLLSFTLDSSLKRLFEFIVAIITIITIVVFAFNPELLALLFSPPVKQAPLRYLPSRTNKTRKINTACIASREMLLLSLLLYNGFHY